MEGDDNSHYLIYRVLGITDREGKTIDLHQNTGRILYNNVGSFLEKTALICFQSKFPNAKSIKIPNMITTNPKTFQIDCLIDHDAIEVKWRDATTDGDHIRKEHTKAKAIRSSGYVPIRVMFYYPNRSQAKKDQGVIETIYRGLDGQYYSGNDAWRFIKDYSDVDLKEILEHIAEENGRQFNK